MNRLPKRETIFLLGYGLWGGLGAYRGADDYNKEYNKNYKFYLKNQNYKKPQYYYLSCFGVSMGYLFGYMVPPFIIFNICNELYNVERKIRGIKDEEEKD